MCLDGGEVIMGVDRDVALAGTRPQLGHAVFYGRDPATAVTDREDV